MATIRRTSSLSFCEMQKGVYSNSFSIGDFSILATKENSISISNLVVNKTQSSLYPLVLNLEDTGRSNDYRCIKFSISRPAIIRVHAKGGLGRGLTIVDSNDTVIDAAYNTTPDLRTYFFNLQYAGEYYLMSLKSNISIYHIKVIMD